MPKLRLKRGWRTLEADVIATMLAGLKEWRPDLEYPESHSDMSGCVRALFRMYDVKRRPIALGELPLDCDLCSGSGTALSTIDGSPDRITRIDCPGCKRTSKEPTP